MGYYKRKIVTLILTLVVVSLLTFFAFQIIPGDSALVKLGMEAGEEELKALRESMGLDLSIPARFVSWIGGAIKGDFGISVQYKLPVSRLIKDRLPVTVGLAVLSFILIVSISIPLGILSSKKKNGAIDRLIQWTSQILMAIPPFFLGIIITLLFGILLKWFVPGGYQSLEQGFWPFISYLFVPAAAVALPKIAMTVRFLRSSIFKEMNRGYVRTARSKGNNQNTILWRHVLKNALMPVVTFLGMILADILAGSIIIEQVFNLPGLGRMLVLAISNRDFAIVQAVVLYMAATVIIINALVDILYHKLDPRVRLT